jgi:hypothetical protein
MSLSPDFGSLWLLLDQAGFITGAWADLRLDDLPEDEQEAFVGAVKEWLIETANNLDE